MVYAPAVSVGRVHISGLGMAPADSVRVFTRALGLSGLYRI